MEVCVLCFSSCDIDYVRLKNKVKGHGRTFSDMLRDHFPFIDVSCLA